MAVRSCRVVWSTFSFLTARPRAESCDSHLLPCTTSQQCHQEGLMCPHSAKRLRLKKKDKLSGKAKAWLCLDS